jgi:hypothetical protein
MSPYDDPAVSAGEIAGYLYSLNPHSTSPNMRSEHEIAALLTRHEQDMASALQREEHYGHGPHADQIAATNAASEHSESEAAAQMLRWVLGLETDADYSHLFPKPS